MTTKTKPETIPAPLATYLMWVGAEHYATIQDWVNEATEMGVSKRLPNEHMARALMENAIVFVAHDEGSYTECEECSGTIDCGECRKREVLSEKHRAVAKAAREGAAKHAADSKEAKAALAKAERNDAKADALDEQIAECEACLGERSITAGTGGKVVFEDGEAWDYRQYNYWLHQPKVWTPEDKGGVAEITRCVCCGGTGRLPEGMAFGLFVPQAIEVIVPEGDAEAEAKAAEAGFTPVSTAVVAKERKRGCGKRKPGGVYVTTTTKGDKKAAKRVKDALKAAGIEREVEVKGNFIQFVEPISIPGVKRFRGLGRIELSALAEGAALSDAAEMALDATE
jgi:hypothetical protein